MTGRGIDACETGLSFGEILALHLRWLSYLSAGYSPYRAIVTFRFWHASHQALFVND